MPATVPPKPGEASPSLPHPDILLKAYVLPLQWLQLVHKPVFRYHRLLTLTPPYLLLLLKPLSCGNFHLTFSSEVSIPQKRSPKFLFFLMEGLTCNGNVHIAYLSGPLSKLFSRGWVEICELPFDIWTLGL